MNIELKSNQIDEREGFGINKDVIKYIAMFTMLLNHIAFGLLEQGTVLYYVFTNAGYFTAITMCYFLVEGYTYTRSKLKYACRLLAFAFISQIPFQMATGIAMLNMMFTLFICFIILVVIDKVNSKLLASFLVTFLILSTVFCDWAFLAGIFTVMFAKWKGQKRKLIFAYAIAVILFGLINFTNLIYYNSLSVAMFLTATSLIGVILSGIVILCFYNGKRIKKATTFSKWFFYVFYPLHLLIIGLIQLLRG